MSCFWDKSNISWFLNVINIFFTFWVYVKYGKKIKVQQLELNQQQKKLNDLNLKKEEREEKEEKSATITLKYVKEKKILIVKNNGKSKARNVIVKSLSDNDPVSKMLNYHFPRKYINPYEEISLDVLLERHQDNIIEYLYKWNDDLGEHEDTQIIQYM